MLTVLTICGHRYPLGPVAMAVWPSYLDGLEKALAPGMTMERAETSAIIRHTATGAICYTLAMEPWPTEREALTAAAHV